MSLNKNMVNFSPTDVNCPLKIAYAIISNALQLQTMALLSCPPTEHSILNAKDYFAASENN